MTLETLKQDIKWWESKRWMYNLAVAVFGGIAIYNGLAESPRPWTRTQTIGVIWWGLGANLFYSTGILFEVFDWYYLNGKLRLRRFRTFFFVVGISLSCLWTATFAWFYFVGHFW